MLRPTVSRNKAPILGLQPEFYYCHVVAGLLMWGPLSDGRTGLSFTIAAGPRQHSHSWVRVPWDSRPYFAVSDTILLFSSPPTTCRATVEVFDPASTRDYYPEFSPESESESHCDWRSVSLSVLVSSPVRGSWPDITSSYCLTISVLSLGGGALSDERVGLSFVRVCQQ
jgi:hypothetical protein